MCPTVDHYYDTNATTPLDERVIQEMTTSFGLFGNISSAHVFGEVCKRKYREAKERIACLLGATAEELIITSGGSESNNLALKGYLSQLPAPKGHLITSQIEHPSVLDVFACLAQAGYRVTYLPVNEHGFVTVEQVAQAIEPDTVLISLMLANNEVGAIQPIAAISQLAQAYGIFLHCDAVQAIGKIPVKVKELGVDALSFSGHKFNGPKGVGGLFLKKGRVLAPLIHGGGQEQGLRAGTENSAAVFGLGVACQVAQEELAARIAHCRRLKDSFLAQLSEQFPHCHLNGRQDEHYLPNTVSLRIEGIRGEALAALLSVNHGIAVSVGSACSTNKEAKLSYVLKAMGLPNEQIRATIRVSFGHHNTEAGLAVLVSAIRDAGQLLRSLSLTKSAELIRL